MSRRGVIVIVSVVVLAGVAGAVALEHHLRRLPDPASADNRGLMRWLVSRDLSHEPDQTQRQLLTRLERFLDESAENQELTADDVVVQIDAGQQAQLGANIDVLLDRWVRRQVDAFHSTPPPQRWTWIDEQLERVGRWNLAQWLALKQPTSAASEKSSTAALMHWVNDWIARQPPDQQQRARQLVGAIERRWFARLFLGAGQGGEARSPF